jgi:hypothetical protein
MKICPKCHSSYSDETLNFCLTDGTPLVKASVYQEITIGGSDEDKTIIDSKYLSSNIDLTNKDKIALRTQYIRPFSKKKIIISSIVGLAILIFSIVIFFRTKQGLSSESSITPRQVNISTKKNDISIGSEQMEKIKTEIIEMLTGWATTNSNKNLDAHLAYYTDTLEIYYTESNKDKNHVRADRIRAYQKYDDVSIQVKNLQISLDSEQVAVIVFDKIWVMKSPQKISTGAVQQEMKLVKQDGRWLIASERDLKVYYINNLEPQQTDSNVIQQSTSALFR